MFVRNLIILALSALFSLAAHGEAHYKPHISVGVHGGMDLGRISFSPSVEQNWAPGITGGLSVRYAEEKLVGILAEVNLMQGGWKELFENSPLSYERKLTYLSLPIMTHIYFGPPRFKCFFNLGPQIGYMIGEKINSNFDYLNPTSSPDWDNEPRMTEQMGMKVKTKFDYGICAGFGCEFWLQPRHSIYVEGRFYYGLGNIFSATKADTFSASRNMTIAVTLGYNFRLR